MKTPFLFFYVIEYNKSLGGCDYGSQVIDIDGELPNSDDIREIESSLSESFDGCQVVVMNFLRLDPLMKARPVVEAKRIYNITGNWVIDEIGPKPDTLDKAIKLAYDYSLSWANNREVFMKVHTEEEPIQYSFGFYADSIVIGQTHWHEVCRVIPSF